MFRKLGILSVTIMLLSWTNCLAEESLAPSESQVKASFLLKFVKFITYPKTALSGTDLNVCVLGDDPFQGFLDTLISNTPGDQMQGHRLKALYLRNLDTVRQCQVVFISKSEQRQLKHILTQMRQQPILTVSDLAEFTVAGGMIQLYTTENKVSFMIDPTTATEAGLTISSRLLQIAKIAKKSPE